MTKANKAKLAALGYTDVAISKMTPDVALGVLKDSIQPAGFTAWLPTFHECNRKAAEKTREEVLCSVSKLSTVAEASTTPTPAASCSISVSAHGDDNSVQHGDSNRASCGMTGITLVPEGDDGHSGKPPLPDAGPSQPK